MGIHHGPSASSLAAKGRFLMTPQEMVREFHEVFGSHIGERFLEVIQLRWKLIAEEYAELGDELAELMIDPENVSCLSRVAKEIADHIYVLYGTGVALGLDIDEAVRRVHASNMSKLVDGQPIMREDGKVLKGPNYQPPSMEGVVLP
jgi:predicted HAD superfamily Cof-like phosphohydrolase